MPCQKYTCKKNRPNIFITSACEKFKWKFTDVKKLLLFFFFMDAPTGYESSWAKNWIQAAAATYAGAAALPDHLTHCSRPGIKPAPPQWPELLQSDS